MRGRKLQLEKPLYNVAMDVPRKNQRIVWTVELHERFLHCANALGALATPSRILQAMNVPGLTRSQVASHFQKCKSLLSSASFETETTQASDTNRYSHVQSRSETYAEALKIAPNSMSLISTTCGNRTATTMCIPSYGFCALH